MSRVPHHFDAEDVFAMATVYLRLNDVAPPGSYGPAASPS
jgi:hypothetical protein